MTGAKKAGLRVLSVLLCFVCLLSCVQPVQALARNTSVIFSAIETTLVRNYASSYADAIGRLENGTAVTVLDERDDFYKVDCYDMTGYIAKEQIVRKADGKYYVNCKKGSTETSSMAGVTLQDMLHLRASVMALAEKQLGTPYVYGGMRPGAFDCSGFTSYVYKNHDYRLHRTADYQMQDGLVVSPDSLLPGDLIFFRDPGAPWLATHVGIYAGNNEIIHAGSRGICFASLETEWFASRYVCARRVIAVSAQTMDAAPAVTVGRATAQITHAGLRTAR